MLPSLPIALFAAFLLPGFSGAAGPDDGSVTKVFYHIHKGNCKSCVDYFNDGEGACWSDITQASNMSMLCPQGANCWWSCFMGGEITDAKPGTTASVSWSFSGVDEKWFDSAMAYMAGAQFCGRQSSGSISGITGGKVMAGVKWGFVSGSGANCECGQATGCMLPGNLVATVVINYMPNKPKCNESKTPFKMKKQSNQQWGTQFIDSCCDAVNGCGCSGTISSKGCAITSLSMVGNMTPDTLNANLISDNGYESYGDVNWEKAANIIGKNFDPKSTDVSKIMNYIESGKTVIAKVKKASGGYHFVLVVGEIWDEAQGKCRITIADPAAIGNDKKYLEGPNGYPEVAGIRVLKE